MTIQDLTELSNRVDAKIWSQPNVSDLNETADWIYKMQVEAATLAHGAAIAEGLWSMCVYNSIREMPKDEYARIKNSSTVTERYIAGLHPQEYEIFKRLDNLKAVVKTIFDNTRTLIVTKREEKQTWESANVNNTNQRGPHNVPFPEYER